MKSLEQQKRSPLREKSFQFAVDIVRLSHILTQDNKEFVLSRQVIRSGTSIGSNIREASYAESKKDFIHKMAIALKECDETLYWLDLLEATDIISTEVHSDLFKKAIELHKMTSASIQTAKYNLNSPSAPF